MGQPENEIAGHQHRPGGWLVGSGDHHQPCHSIKQRYKTVLQAQAHDGNAPAPKGGG